MLVKKCERIEIERIDFHLLRSRRSWRCSQILLHFAVFTRAALARAVSLIFTRDANFSL